MSCVKTAELINLPFGLWTQVGRRKQKFNHSRQVAQICTSLVTFARWHQCPWRHCATSCAKMAEPSDPVDLPFGLWTQVGRRKEKFNCICRRAPMCPREEYMVLKTK